MKTRLSSHLFLFGLLVVSMPSSRVAAQLNCSSCPSNPCTSTCECGCSSGSYSIVCWDGGGAGGSWNDEENWNPTGVPGANDDNDIVCHLSGATIIHFDRGAATTIASYYFDSTLNAGLMIDDTESLTVVGDLIPLNDEAASSYDLTVKPGASFVVDKSIKGIDHCIMGDLDESDNSTINFTNPEYEIDNEFEIGDLSMLGTATIYVYGPPGHIEASNGIVLDGGSEYASSLKWNHHITVPEGASLVMDAGAQLQNSSYDLELNGPGLLELTDVSYGTVGSGTMTAFCPSATVADTNYIYAYDTLQFGIPSGSGGTGVGALIPMAGPSSDLRIDLLRGKMKVYSHVHDEAADWDSSMVDLNLCLASYSNGEDEAKVVEVFSPDFEDIWFADSPCVKPWRNFAFIAGGCVDLVQNPCTTCPNCELEFEDTEDNINDTVDDGLGNIEEAMYVLEDITVSDVTGVSVAGDVNIYYLGTYDGPVAYDGDPFIHIARQTLYGDWNNDCTLTVSELLALNGAKNQPENYVSRMDFECDGDVDQADVDQFAFNVNYNCDWVELCGGCEEPECGETCHWDGCCEESLLGGGMGEGADAYNSTQLAELAVLVSTTGSPEALATWIGRSMSQEGIEDAITMLQAIAGEESETPLGAAAAWLANFLGS